MIKSNMSHTTYLKWVSFFFLKVGKRDRERKGRYNEIFVIDYMGYQEILRFVYYYIIILML